jgi:hypothetical protein
MKVRTAIFVDFEDGSEPTHMTTPWHAISSLTMPFDSLEMQNLVKFHCEVLLNMAGSILVDRLEKRVTASIQSTQDIK